MMGEESSAASGRLPRLGELVAGKYRIARIIGEGGMGVVFEALHERLNQRFALKVLRCNEMEKADEYFGRFEREARAAAKLKGKNVARVTDVDTLPDGTPFLVMEYLEGGDLDSELERRGRLPVGESVDYVLQACSAVAEAHSRSIVHRDLKPHNLFLTQEDGEVVVKLLDFGISKVQDEAEKSVTLTRSTLGTPLYMAPEQIRATQNADPRSDIWSLGIILYELLTGKTPFDGENPAAVIAAITADEVPPPKLHRPELSDALNEVVMRSLRKRPDERFQTAKDFADALEPFAERATWMPPPRISGVDFRVSIPEYPTLSFQDSSAAADTSAQPAAAVAMPVAPARRRFPVVIVALLAVAIAGTLIFFATRRTDAALTSPATPVADSKDVPTELTVSAAMPSPTPSVVAPAPAVEAAIAGSVTASGPAKATPPSQRPSSVKMPKRGAPAAAPAPAAKPEPAPKAEAPAPAPAPATENPVHL